MLHQTSVILLWYRQIRDLVWLPFLQRELCDFVPRYHVALDLLLWHYLIKVSPSDFKTVYDPASGNMIGALSLSSIHHLLLISVLWYLFSHLRHFFFVYKSVPLSSVSLGVYIAHVSDEAAWVLDKCSSGLKPGRQQLLVTLLFNQSPFYSHLLHVHLVERAFFCIHNGPPFSSLPKQNMTFMSF